jgi:hypothetical protein
VTGRLLWLCRDPQVQRLAFDLLSQLPSALLASTLPPEGE